MLLVPHLRMESDWERDVGRGFHDIIGTITGDGWMNRLGGTQLDVWDEGNHALHFSVSGNPALLDDYQDNFSMMVLFHYQGDPKSVRLMSVSSHPDLHYAGIAAPLMAHMAQATLYVGARKLHVHPAQVGSYVWLRGGAIPDAWPEQNSHQPFPRHTYMEDIPFHQRFERILGNPSLYLPGCSAEDVAWLRHIYETHDVMGLCVIAARDDLFVTCEAGTKKLGQVLLKNTALGHAVFDLDHLWTVKRLKSYAGLDVETERTLRAARPDFKPAFSARTISQALPSG